MEKKQQKTGFSVWFLLACSLFSLFTASMGIMDNAPEHKFFLGLLTGLGVGVIVVAVWLYVKDHR